MIQGILEIAIAVKRIEVSNPGLLPYNMHMKRGNYMKKRIAVALTSLCITLLTGCGMSAKMEINPDLSGTVSMEVDTTSEEEKQIEQYMNSQQGSTTKTYA